MGLTRKGCEKIVLALKVRMDAIKYRHDKYCGILEENPDAWKHVKKYEEMLDEYQDLVNRITEEMRKAE